MNYDFNFLFHVKDVLNSTTSCMKKKRGPSRGPSKPTDGKKRKVSTNEYGQPNSGDENYKALVTSIGIMARTHIPIIYKDFRDVPHSFIDRVIKNLKVIIYASIKSYLQLYFYILNFHIYIFFL